jgi:two-component system nitrate/nitrite response regulator NarL
MLGRLDVVGDIECQHSVDALVDVREARGGQWSPDVVIVNSAPDGDAAGRVRTTFPTSRVLELVPSAGSEDLAMAAKTRADGYVMLQDITHASLHETLRTVMRGQLAIPPPVANYLLEHARTTAEAPPRIQAYFSPRELDVIGLLVEGLGNQQIANRLGISLHSAKRHVSAVLHKVNSPSRTAFVACILRDDLDIRSAPTRG